MGDEAVLVHNYTPSEKTQVQNMPEKKAEYQVKKSEAVDFWDEYLGPGQTDINPRTGLPDPDRIFSADGTKSVRFSPHEMKSFDTAKAHFHIEEWVYDSVNDIMTVFNTLIRMKKG